MSEEIKPCAHCGGEGRLYENRYNRGESAYYRIACYGECGIETSACGTPAAAAALWNTRAPDPRIAELEAQLAGVSTHYARNLVRMVEDLRDGEVLHVRRFKDGAVKMEIVPAKRMEKVDG